MTLTTDLPPMLWDGDQPRFASDSPRTRRTDPITSHQAADSNDLHGSQLAVLRVLAMQPFAQFEIVDVLDLSPSSFANGIRYTDSRIRSACSELVQNGLVEDAGEKRVTPSGRSAVVWQLTANGREVVAS